MIDCGQFAGIVSFTETGPSSGDCANYFGSYDAVSSGHNQLTTSQVVVCLSECTTQGCTNGCDVPIVNAMAESCGLAGASTTTTTTTTTEEVTTSTEETTTTEEVTTTTEATTTTSEETTTTTVEATTSTEEGASTTSITDETTTEDETTASGSIAVSVVTL